MNYQFWRFLIFCFGLMQGLCASFATDKEECKESFHPQTSQGRRQQNADMDDAPLKNSQQLQQNIQNKNREEFYVFGVGQGNSQLAVYEGNGFAVLYDCGSSSLQKHTKYKDPILKTDATISNALYRRIKERVDQEQSSLGEEQQKIYSLQDNTLIQAKNPIGSLLEKMKIKQKEKVERKPSITSNEEGIPADEAQISHEDLKGFIKEKISNYNITHLFIFLSHPDKDHINYISDKTIPEGTSAGILKITAFLGGHWFSEYKNADKNQNIPYRVADFLLDRENTWVEFPYYWNHKIPKITRVAFKDNF